MGKSKRRRNKMYPSRIQKIENGCKILPENLNHQDRKESLRAGMGKEEAEEEVEEKIKEGRMIKTIMMIRKTMIQDHTQVEVAHIVRVNQQVRAHTPHHHLIPLPLPPPPHLLIPPLPLLLLATLIVPNLSTPS